MFGSDGVEAQNVLQGVHGLVMQSRYHQARDIRAGEAEPGGKVMVACV